MSSFWKLVLHCSLTVCLFTWSLLGINTLGLNISLADKLHTVHVQLNLQAFACRMVSPSKHRTLRWHHHYPVHSPFSFYRTQWIAWGSVFGAVCDFFVCVWNISGTAEQICAKFTVKTCLVPHSDEFECHGQRSRLPGTKSSIFQPFRQPGCGAVYVWYNICSSSSLHLLWKRTLWDMWHHFMGQPTV